MRRWWQLECPECGANVTQRVWMTMMMGVVSGMALTLLWSCGPETVRVRKDSVNELIANTDELMVNAQKCMDELSRTSEALAICKSEAAFRVDVGDYEPDQLIIYEQPEQECVKFIVYPLDTEGCLPVEYEQPAPTGGCETHEARMCGPLKWVDESEH